MKSNELQCISSHWQLDYILSNLFKPTTKKASKAPRYRYLVTGKHRRPVNFTHNVSIMRKTFPCGDGIVDIAIHCKFHYSDVIMSAMVSQITGVSIDCLINYSGADQRKYKSSASLAFVRGIHQWPVNFPHSGPVTRKMISFDDVIMCLLCKTSDCDSWRRTQNIEWYMTSHEWQYFWSQVGWFPNYFTNDTETYQQITSWLTRKSFYFAASYFCLITDIFLMSQGCIQISYM